MGHLRIAGGVALLALTTASVAAELEYGISGGLGTSDNVLRVPVNEQDETISIAGLEFRLLRDEGKLDADIDIDLAYFHYQKDSFDNELLGMADAQIQYAFIPDRFEWILSDSFGQTSLQPFLVATPDTRENINYFTTGPELTFRVGTRGTIILVGRYASTWYEESNFDDERLLGGISFGREMSAHKKVSLNATTERFEFDDVGAGSNYDRQQLYVRYETDSPRMNIVLDAGYSVLRDFDDTSDSPLFELDFSRAISDRSTITVRGGVELSDAASSFREDNIFGGGSPSQPEQISTTDPFEARRAELEWEFTGQRTNIILNAGYGEDTYERLSEFDRKSDFLYASAERELTRLLCLRVDGSSSSYDYQEAGQDYDETRIGIHLTMNIARHMYAQVYFERYDRDSSDALTEYRESRAFLLLGWRNRRSRLGLC